MVKAADGPHRPGGRRVGQLRLVVGELGSVGPARAEENGAPTAEERAEIPDLRGKCDRTRRERDILAQAVAFFSGSPSISE